MSEILPFDFEGTAVRVIETEGGLCFVAADVCRVLGIAKHRDAMARLDRDEGRRLLVDTLGGPQKMACVTEPGLYRLIFKSRKDQAKRFQKWVFAEVLPAIRKTGKYEVSPEDQEIEEIETEEAPRMTIPEFLHTHEVFGFNELMAFGAKVRHLNQALGVKYEFTRHPRLGKVRSYAMPVLNKAWAIFSQQYRMQREFELPLSD